MLEQPDDLAKSSPSDLPSISEEYKKSVLIQIDDRLANAKTSEDAASWLRVRSALIQQNEIIKDGNLKRYVEKFKLFRRTGISVAALIIGTVTIGSGSILPGLVILGVAFYEVAPDYVKARFPGKSTKQETDEDKEDD